MKRMAFSCGAVLVVGLVIAACSDSTESGTDSEDCFTAGTSYDPYANLDTDLGESIWPNEKEDIAATAEIITTFIKRRHDEGRTDGRGRVRYMRDAHAKTHGCVKAEFKVRDDVPADMRVGVFAATRTFKSWIRYSNGNSEVRYDWKHDARGMAIKLTNVDGQKLVSDFPEQSTQDFVMINHPVFFVDNPVQYAETLKVFHSGLGFETLAQVLSIAKLPLANAELALLVNGSQIRSPLREPYWSMTPYRLGRGHAVKFAAIPVTCGEENSLPRDRAAQVDWIANAKSMNKAIPVLPQLGRDALRQAMQATLEEEHEDVCFLFALQPHVDASRTPIEQSTVNWDGASAFVPVANIRIPAQKFSSLEEDTFCDDMTFTPWHALPEHKPLGVVNRTRLVVYAATSKLRREGNAVKSSALDGPTGDESF